ncbi:uncharacterized protein [Anabrus simplex]
MCALVFLRAVQTNSSFTMTSKDPHAGGFDDIVFSYRSPGNEQNILVQLNASTLPFIRTTTVKESLMYYFNSLKTAGTSKYITNCTFVFFTTADVKFTPTGASVDSHTKKLLCTTWKPKDVFAVDPVYHSCECCKDDIGADDWVYGYKILIFRNQCGPINLDELIKQELVKICNGVISQCHFIKNNFVEKIKAWWEEPEKPALDENWKEWIEMKEHLLCQNTLLQEIKFREDVLSHLETTVLRADVHTILLQSEKDETKIACSKVYQTFIRKENFRVLFTDISEPQESLKMLFKLWLEDVYDVLVITDVTNCSQNLREIITCSVLSYLRRKIVIVSSRDGDELMLPEVLRFYPDFIKSTFNQLDDKSQHRLWNLPVDFHGKRITLGSIQADKVLEGGILQDVLTSPKLQICIRTACM